MGQWRFHIVMECLPIVLQLSLLLLGCALYSYLWSTNPIAANVVLAVTAFRVAFYVFVTVGMRALVRTCCCTCSRSEVSRWISWYPEIATLLAYLRPSWPQHPCIYGIQPGNHPRSLTSHKKSRPDRFISPLSRRSHRCIADKLTWAAGEGPKNPLHFRLLALEIFTLTGMWLDPG